MGRNRVEFLFEMFDGQSGTAGFKNKGNEAFEIQIKWNIFHALLQKFNYRCVCTHNGVAKMWGWRAGIAEPAFGLITLAIFYCFAKFRIF